MRVVLVGGGGHASDVLSAFEAISKQTGSPHPVIGMVADVEIDLGRFAGRGVRQIGDIGDLKQIDATHYVLAIGYSRPRRDVYARVKDCGLEAAAVVHPRADLPPSLEVGPGTVVLAGAQVSPMARVGRHVYLSYSSFVGHDCDIQDFVTVLPGAVVSGDTALGEACLIGANATVIERVAIGAGAIVGAGSVVLRDIPPDVTAVGSPARVLDR
jgi:sugar O-acyltransferase (sialic acid O-acetyltransferase NeuD family)